MRIQGCIDELLLVCSSLQNLHMCKMAIQDSVPSLAIYYILLYHFFTSPRTTLDNETLPSLWMDVCLCVSQVIELAG